jgi:hypothetical protein
MPNTLKSATQEHYELDERRRMEPKVSALRLRHLTSRKADPHTRPHAVPDSLTDWSIENPPFAGSSLG